MGDSDAEWVGVDFEFPKVNPQTTARPVTRRPFTERPAPTRRPFTERPFVGGPHEAPEVERPINPNTNPDTLTIASSVIGGVLGLALVSLLIYMLVLRRRLNKAKLARDDSQYQLRVEDVAHLSNLDETANTYVNTTDLQKLLSSVRAKKKGQEPPPPLPKLQHQTPTAYRAVPNPKEHPTSNQSDNRGFVCDPDVVVVRAPMPVPHCKTDLDKISNDNISWEQSGQGSEAIYSNVELEGTIKLAKPPSRRKIEAPAIAPPPPPTKQKNQNAVSLDMKDPQSPTVIARPAPPPPALARTKSVEEIEHPKVEKISIPNITKPTPPVAPKPNKNIQPTNIKPVPLVASKPTPPNTSKPTPPNTSKPTPDISKPTPIVNKPVPPTASKPAPPVASKPGVLSKGKALPPLKMALLPSLSKKSLDNCSTPDTGIIELTPENTPTPNTGSISSKIAFLEGKMKTPVLPKRALTQIT